MPTEDADDNKAYCRAYHARLKADPEKYARRLASIAEARKRRRASGVSPVSKPVKHPVKQQPATGLAGRVQTKGDVREVARERAAIMEVDGGLLKSQAESETLSWLLAELGEKVLGVGGLFDPQKPDGKTYPDEIPPPLADPL